MPPVQPGAGVTWEPGFVVRGVTPQLSGDVGGNAIVMKAAAALNVGDAVYISAANTVDKGATANLGKRAGVVVGGVKTRWRTIPEMRVGDVAAAAANDLVLVCFVSGVVTVTTDGVVAFGDPLSFAGTAGRVITAAAGGALTAGVRGNVIGSALEASAGAGNTIRALIDN